MDSLFFVFVVIVMGWEVVCFFSPHCVACGTSLTWGPGIELMPLAVETQSLNHWTTREVLNWF